MGCEEDFHCNDLVKVNLPWFFSSFFPGLFDWTAFNWVWFERSRTPARVTYQSCLWPLKCGDVTSGTTDVVLRASRLLKLPKLCPSIDVRVLGWIECKFVLLFWVLYVTSPANLQKFVSRPFINITSEINSLCFSLWLREAHRWWSLKLISQLFLRLRSLLMERVEKSPKPVGRIAKTSLPQTKYFEQIFCSSRKDSTAGNVRLRCLW